MSEFMLTVFFGAIFVFAMVYMIEGLAFLNRVLLIIWFDFDYVEKNREWVSKTRESIHRMLDRLSKKKAEKEKEMQRQIDEAKALLVIDEEVQDE